MLNHVRTKNYVAAQKPLWKKNLGILLGNKMLHIFKGLALLEGMHNACFKQNYCIGKCQSCSSFGLT